MIVAAGVLLVVAGAAALVMAMRDVRTEDPHTYQVRERLKIEGVE